MFYETCVVVSDLHQKIFIKTFGIFPVFDDLEIDLEIIRSQFLLPSIRFSLSKYTVESVLVENISGRQRMINSFPVPQLHHTDDEIHANESDVPHFKIRFNALKYFIKKLKQVL